MEFPQFSSSSLSGQSFHPSHSQFGWRHSPVLHTNWLGLQVSIEIGQYSHKVQDTVVKMWENDCNPTHHHSLLLCYIICCQVKALFRMFVQNGLIKAWTYSALQTKPGKLQWSHYQWLHHQPQTPPSYGGQRRSGLGERCSHKTLDIIFIKKSFF